MAHSVANLHTLCHTLNSCFESHQFLCAHVQVHRSKSLGYYAGHQEVSRCYTKGESEESIACKRQSIQARDWHWLWNPGQITPEVQSRSIRGPTKRLMFSNFFKVHASSCLLLLHFYFSSNKLFRKPVSWNLTLLGIFINYVLAINERAVLSQGLFWIF